MDRKTRIREYKESYRPMGVFLVRNTATGRVLLGSTPDLPAMLNRQRFQLEMGGHPDKGLQRDWDDLGPDAFEFLVGDTLEPPEEPGWDPAEDLKVLERMWAEKLEQAGTPRYGVR